MRSILTVMENGSKPSRAWSFLDISPKRNFRFSGIRGKFFTASAAFE
jgi:hypothetical protein